MIFQYGGQNNMHDMFETYDYEFKKPSVRKNPYTGPSKISTGESKWLISATGKTLGATISHTDNSKLYFSYVVDEKNYKDIFSSSKTKKLTCSFLDKAYEPVLTKEISCCYPGIFEININANELDIGNYFLDFSETLPSEEDEEEPKSAAISQSSTFVVNVY